MKEQSTSVHFENELEKLPEPDWQNKKCKYRYRHTMLTEKNRKNTAA